MHNAPKSAKVRTVHFVLVARTSQNKDHGLNRRLSAIRRLVASSCSKKKIWVVVKIMVPDGSPV